MKPTKADDAVHEVLAVVRLIGKVEVVVCVPVA
jgi:hypothetical protein